MNNFESMSISVFLSRLNSGELCASVGIEGYSEMNAEAPELGWIERHSDNTSTITFGLLFSLLGTFQPLGVSVRQKVSVIHHGLDLVVLLRGVPALRDIDFLVHDILSGNELLEGDCFRNVYDRT